MGRSPGPDSSLASAPIGWGWGLAWWSGLLFAFAPSLQAGFAPLAAQPWTRGTLIFPLLVLLAARAEPRPARSRLGGLLVVAGIGIQLLAIGGGVVRAGRLGFVVAAIGLCRGAGWCSWPVALLLGFLLPLPHAVVELGSPGLEGAFAAAAAALARGVGLDVVPGRGLLQSGDATLRLADHDGGLALLFLLAGLAWFVELRAPSASTSQRLRRFVLWLLAAVALQLALVSAAALVLGSQAPDAAAHGRAILDHLPWLLTWTFGIVLAWKAHSTRTSRRPLSIAEGDTA